MSFTDLGSLCTNNTRPAATATWSFSPNSQLNAGEFGLLVFGTDNVPTTDGDFNEHWVYDSVGNPWWKIGEFTNGQGAGAAGATASIWGCLAIVNLPVSGTINFQSEAAVSAKAVTGRRFSVSAGNHVRVKASASLANDGADAGPITLSGLASKEYLFVRGGGVEGIVATYTASTNYAAFVHTSSTTSGTSTTGMGARGEFRILTGTGDTTDPTTAVADQASIMVALEEYTPPQTYTSLAHQDIVATQATFDLASSITIPANKVCVVCVNNFKAGATADTPTLTDDNGRTWNQVDTVAYNTIASSLGRVTVFWSVAGVSHTGKLHAAFGGVNQTECCFDAGYWSNANTVSPIIQHATNRVDAGSSLTVTLAAAQSASSAFMAFFACPFGIDSALPIGKVGWLFYTGHNEGAVGFVNHFSPTDVTPTWKFGAAQAARDVGGVAFEVALAPIAYTLSAAQGSFAIAGQAASFRVDRLLSAAPGTFIISGQAASLVVTPGLVKRYPFWYPFAKKSLSAYPRWYPLYDVKAPTP